MTAPENMQNLPCGLLAGCCRFSTVKEKRRGKHCPLLIALACTAFRRKDWAVVRPFRGNGGFGVPEAVQRGRPLFFWQRVISRHDVVKSRCPPYLRKMG